jgi:hypothetical protein
MDRASNDAKAAILDSTNPEIDGLKKSDSRFGSAAPGLKTGDHGNGRQDSSFRNSW